MNLHIELFDKYESEVRSYCRSFPSVFHHSKGPFLYDENNNEYIDFFSGSGSLNYGHNPSFIKQKLIEFIEDERVMMALDFYTTTKREFIDTFVEVILKPRNLDYKIQFCAPTGANAIEAALKLARLATGRTQIYSFTSGWHGMTMGCLSVTGNKEHRKTAGVPLPYTTVMPYEHGSFSLPNSMDYIEHLIEHPQSGFDLPAAFLVETVQSEGGVYIASNEWMQRLRSLCDRHGIFLIVDDIQVGCGRTGDFFSFERSGIQPDVICLAKSISGYGMPMAVNLIKRDKDTWNPGEHMGTFRGNQLAFLGATVALDMWRTEEFSLDIKRKHQLIMSLFVKELFSLNEKIEVRGIGLIIGIDLGNVNNGSAIAKQISQVCFEKRLIIERAGPDDTVLKVMPPLITSDDVLLNGCSIVIDAVKHVLLNNE